MFLHKALFLMRQALEEREAAFRAGLAMAGYSVCDEPFDPQPGDLLTIWNRYRAFDDQARRFEAAGARVLVLENGYLGKFWRGQRWYAMSEGHHNGAGTWPDGGPQRWDSWDVELDPWREGTETVILGQRGIGEAGIKSPDRWAETTQRSIGGRIRTHPGKYHFLPSLDEDLKRARCVVTWASGAALVALTKGVPVFYQLPKWIGAQAGRPIAEYGQEPKRDDGDRLAMFRRLAWAMWGQDEIVSGEAFAAYA